ncbi:hypothetical protein OX283_011705 [Flavobacterium sp. SUN052]|uniref:hypothetical protein n=1 Tax=Flavobacterium sp. SUN052 TaxID=3002441 RepID=UPI00237EA8B6|nr:hypothetical protein [Flavobacterium sp. SUN052]MEC4005323.1 hypothetical protein [Flavobacterium sp. SUN052]
MKKVAFIIFLTFGVNHIVNAQAKTNTQIEINEKNICNKWIFKDIINKKLSKKEVEENKSLLEGVYIEIKLDKTCTTSFVFDLEGTWSLDLSKKIITITDRRGTVNWKIHSLTKNEIQLSRNDAEQIIIFKAGN